MSKTIIQYQKAFNLIIEKLKSNRFVISVMVFGSMVTGDLWDESDIDLLVIVNNEDEGIKNIFAYENEIPLHINIIGKNMFLKLCEGDLKGGDTHRIFASSKLVFSKDDDVTMRYNNSRYYPDIDKERWNMVYLSNLFKSLKSCKKHIKNDDPYMSYLAIIDCVEDYSKLFVNFSGYMISKDVVKVAMSLDNDFKECVDGLFFNKKNTESINTTIKYIQNFLDNNLESISMILLNYMKEKSCLLSSEDIKRDELFKDFNIDFEIILFELQKLNMVKKDGRDLKDRYGDVLFVENVYTI